MGSLRCCGVWRTHDQREAQLVCTVCGDVRVFHDPSAASEHSASMGTMMSRPQRYAYKRITHFRMWLDRVEGRDTIKEEVLWVISPILRAFGKADASRVRSVLRECKVVGHLNSTPAILWHVYGVRPFQLEPTVRANLESMFQDIEAAFHRVRGTRKNMLSYSFLMTRMMELLGVDADFEEIKQMKHPSKIMEADLLWSKICHELEFPFHASFK